jgi:hypothetical protein
MALIRSLIFLAVVGGLVFCGATVPLGNHTFFGHVSRIWKAPETREMVDGVKETSKPVVEKVKRGIEAGYREATRDGGGRDAGADARSDDVRPAR